MSQIHIRKTFILASGFAAGAVAIFAAVNAPPANAASPADRDAVYTAVFQKMMARRKEPYIGLSIGSKDPDSAIMKQFQGAKGVIPGSRIKLTRSGFVDKTTGGKAEVFIVRPATLKWDGQSKATIDAQAHGTGHNGFLGNYLLVRRGGHWAISAYTPYRISF